MRRIARMADGWMPLVSVEDPSGRDAMARVQQYTEEAGRDPKTLGLMGVIRLGGKDPDAWAAEAEAWEQIGATHVSLNTSGTAFSSPQEHMDAIRRFRELVS